ncbi:MAG: phosphoadenylyl-sulfate reductase [Myxococcales bacterium]|nr:phosphoadenylyl-sulfate reductase [Myxococcales bacterium]HIK83520.1 phosphoadenylyl-sulfate reductase [Myxococcales bacterium]
MSLHSVATLEEKSFDNNILELVERDTIESWSAEEILTWAVGKFSDKLTIAASFGAPEGMVLVDMLHRLDPATRVFVLDTGRLHPATYDLIDRVRDRYGKSVEVVFPNHEDVEKMVREKGMNLFYETLKNRQLCCQIRKVQPMRRHLAGFDAYVTGLRRDQNLNRADTRKAVLDSSQGGVMKLNPLADWTHERVMDYVGLHTVPINRLHREGYPSVGCEPCTRAVGLGDDLRAGRWWWENDDVKECGLHVQEEADGSGI